MNAISASRAMALGWLIIGGLLLLSRLNGSATLGPGDAKSAKPPQQLTAAAGALVAGLVCLLLGAGIRRAAALRQDARRRGMLAAIVCDSDDAIVSESLDGKITSWNAAAERLYGYPAGEVLGKTITFLLPQEQVGRFERIRSLVRQGHPFPRFETNLIRKDGSSIDVSLSVSPVKDLAGKVVGIAEFARDISDRMEIQDYIQRLGFERHKLLQRLRLQIERLPLAYVLLDADCCIVDWNPAAEATFGFSRVEAMGMQPPFEKLVPRSSWLRMEELRERMRSGDMEAHSVNENLTKDGRTITCEWFNTPLLSDDAEFEGALCLARDITAQRLAEQTTVESQERFDLAIRGSNDGLGDWNLETGAAFWSPRLSEMLGYTQAEFGTTFDSVSTRMHPDDRDRVLEEISIAVRERARNKSEFRLLTKSGEYLWVQGRGQAVYDETGKPLRFAGALTDISERKQIEAHLAQRDEQLQQSQKLKAVGSLAGGISHEFNNLLQVIRGYSQYAMHGLPKDGQRYQDLEQVVHAADRAASVTRQLLGFSRLQVLERASFDHREVLRDLVKLLRPLIGEHIELQVELAAEATPVHADRGLVQQMLLNLCINARDSMPAGGRLTLKSECVELSPAYCRLHPKLKPGRYVVLSIADTGCGMSPEVKERVFEPFFTTKGVGKGTGLGLAMVYGCVRQHGGAINVYSEVGLGTTFRIHLPIAAGAALQTHQEPAAPARGGNETILVAEDEPMVRDLAMRILTSAGYFVVVAADGMEAVEAFKANADAISLVLLDAVMPKMTGHQAYDRIKLIHSELPVIFCSGYDPETSQIKSFMDQGCRLIQKPYDPELLLKAVREVLDQSYSGQPPLCMASTATTAACDRIENR